MSKTKQIHDALKAAQREASALPVLPSGKRHGNALNHVCRRLTLALVSAGVSLESARKTAAAIHHRFHTAEKEAL